MNNQELYRKTFSKLRISQTVCLEGQSMKTKKPMRIMIIVAATLAVLTCSAVAATILLSPREVANEAGYKELAGAFTSGLEINETKEVGAYTVTVQGITSGRNLTGYVEGDADLDSDRSYLVLSTRYTDGRAIELAGGTDLQFTPLVSGYQPHQVNAWTLSGGCSAFVRDGTEYTIFECDTLEIFADRTVYVAAYEGAGCAPNSETFTLQENGQIRFAEGYKGGALFTLPLDPAQADPAAVRDFEKTIGID